MTYQMKSILLVDDNPDDAALTLRAFKRSNFFNPIDVVCDGVEALDYLFAQNAYGGRVGKSLPDLIILDLNLPKLDGLGVLKAIRADERTKFIPVVIMTSSKEDQDIISGYQFGANSYMRKPVDFNEFLEATKVLGLYWMMINLSPPTQPIDKGPGQ